MSAYDNVFALLISTMTAGSWDEAQALMEKVRAEDGQYADWYRDLTEAIAQTMQDPDRWNDADDSPAVQIRYVQWLAVELERVRAELAALPAPVVETAFRDALGNVWPVGHFPAETEARVLETTPTIQRTVRISEWTEVTS